MSSDSNVIQTSKSNKISSYEPKLDTISEIKESDDNVKLVSFANDKTEVKLYPRSSLYIFSVFNEKRNKNRKEFYVEFPLYLIDMIIDDPIIYKKLETPIYYKEEEKNEIDYFTASMLAYICFTFGYIYEYSFRKAYIFRFGYDKQMAKVGNKHIYNNDIFDYTYNILSSISKYVVTYEIKELESITKFESEYEKIKGSIESKINLFQIYSDKILFNILECSVNTLNGINEIIRETLIKFDDSSNTDKDKLFSSGSYSLPEALNLLASFSLKHSVRVHRHFGYKFEDFEMYIDNKKIEDQNLFSLNIQSNENVYSSYLPFSEAPLYIISWKTNNESNRVDLIPLERYDSFITRIDEKGSSVVEWKDFRIVFENMGFDFGYFVDKSMSPRSSYVYLDSKPVLIEIQTLIESKEENEVKI